jgi:hypothetical protein
MGQWMMLGEVIGQIGFYGFPVDDDLSLVNPVADPVETHVYGFGSALLNSIVGYAFSAFVVCLDGCGRLWIAEFFEGDADAAGILCDVEQSTEFSFSCGRHEMLDDDTGDVYGAVGGGRVGWVMLDAEVEIHLRGNVLVTRIDMTRRCGW